MMRKTGWALALFLGFAFGHFASSAMIEQDKSNSPPSVSDAEYNPNPNHPFGRMNPNAPPELMQFDFMIGEFDTIEQIRRQDGTWKESRATWNANYFMNGFGIQDHYWNEQEQFATSNIRIYDSQKEKWIVTFFKMPGYQSGVYEGKKEGDKMVIRRGDDTNGTRLTFYNISKDGYDWIGETLKDGKAFAFWKESARRRK